MGNFPGQRANQTSGPAGTACSKILFTNDALANTFREKRYCKLFSQETLLPDVLVAAQKFVTLDGGNHADGALIARLGSLNASEATHAHGACEGDLVRQGEKNFDGRAFPDVLGKEEVNTAGTHVAGLGGGFAHRRTGGPAHGEGQAHLKALGGTAFGAAQRETSCLRGKCSREGGLWTIGLRVQKGFGVEKYECTRTGTGRAVARRQGEELTGVS
jgi:hypothetical protein